MSENINGIISRAVQAGIPLELVRAAIDKDIPISDILDRYLQEEKPNRWTPYKVKQVKTSVLNMWHQPILPKNLSQHVFKEFYYRYVLLLETTGISIEIEGYEELLLAAKQHFKDQLSDINSVA